MRMLSKLFLTAVLAFAMSSTAMAQVDDILEAHFQAVGGIEKLSEIKTVKRSGSATLSGVAGNLEGTREEAAVVGKKSYAKNDLGIISDTTGWNGTTGWKVSPAEGLADLEGPDLDLAKAATHLDPLHSVVELFGSAALTLGSDRAVYGKDCVTLNLAGAPISYFVDKESQYLVGIELTTTDPAMGEIALMVGYGDYAEFGGVMLPNTTSLDIANGMITVDTTFEKTEIDVELDESIFEKP
jgi:hypothetical protein